jgi:translation elongation factor EF-Tu-like GTPase
MRAFITLDAVGGRTTPVHARARTYRPHFVPNGSSSMLGVELTNGPETVAPGGSGEVEFECLYSAVSYDELRPGLELAIVEGARRVGRGAVR